MTRTTYNDGERPERGKARVHGHTLPDLDAPPGLTLYEDGCSVLKKPDGESIFVPEDIRNIVVDLP